MRARKAAIAVAALFLLLLVGAAAVTGWVMTTDLRPLVERKVSEALGRRVSVGALHIGWGDPLALDIEDLRIANAPWGSRPDMITVERIHALIDVRPLFKGVIRYSELSATKPFVLLERNPQGVGNWKFAGMESSAGGSGGSAGGFAIVPKDRTQFPTLLDFTLQDGQVIYRTTSGKALVTDLGRVAIQTSDDDQPVTVNVTGAYNGLPAQVSATTASFNAMRSATTPFATSFTLTTDDGTVSFRGAMMQPLDFDGVAGRLTIDMQKLTTLLKALDAELPADFPATFVGDFTHSQDHWQLDAIQGDLAKNAFTGALILDEGPRGGTDRIGLQADFDTLLVDSLLPKSKAGSGKSDFRQTALTLPDRKAPAVSAKLAAHRLRYGKLTLADFGFTGSAKPGSIVVERLKFGLAGATLQLNGRADPAGDATRLRLTAGFPGADIGQLLKTFGLVTDQISGELSLRAELDATGAKLGDALAHSRGNAVLAMVGGRIARDLLEKASADLRTLFRAGTGMSDVRCLLGVAAIENGIATVSPLVLRTPEATLNGGGTVDLRNGTVDLQIKSDRASTGFFALDLPIRIAGPFAALSAKPAAKTDKAPPTTVTKITEAARKMAEASGCLR